MLEYDNSAFYYFMIATCTVYLIPSTHHVIQKLSFLASSRKVDVGKARTSIEQAKYERLEREQRNSKAGMSRAFVLNMIATIATWCMFFYLISLVWNDHEIAKFDPFEILGIAPDSKLRVIKKAYRTLSLKYHPDKHPAGADGAEEAADMFMKVASAYAALTDETAKKNFEKFGNPEGRQSMEVSIGLPTFLLEKENHQVILVLYLLVLVVAIPVCVCLWYNESKQYMDNMIRHDTMEWYGHMLSEHTHLKVLPEILAGSSEYVLKLKIKQEQLNDISDLERGLKGYTEQMQKEKYQHRPPEKSKGYYLLHAHIFKLNIGSTLEPDLSFMLEKAPYLLEGLLMYSASRRWLQTTKNLIEFSQRLVQSVWVKESSLTQLPHFGEDEVKHATRSSKHKVRKLLDWIETPKADRAGLKDFDNQKLIDIDEAVKCIPNIKCTFTIGVEDEDTICQGDMLTLTVDMDRSNLEPGEDAGPVHAPNWPSKREETWFVFGGMGNELRFFKKITSQSKHVTEKVQLPGPGVPQTYEMDVFLMCDSYVDVDVHEKVKFTVKSSAGLPAYKAHEEDLALDEEQTLFETVMDGAGASDSDEDDGSNSDGSDSDWDDADSLLTPAQKEKRKEKRRKQKEKGRAAAGASDEEKEE